MLDAFLSGNLLQITSKLRNLNKNHTKDINKLFIIPWSQELLTIYSVLQNSNTFNKSRETVRDTISRFSFHFSELP